MHRHTDRPKIHYTRFP